MCIRDRSWVGSSVADQEISYHPTRDRTATDRSISGITVYMEENDAARLNHDGFAISSGIRDPAGRFGASAGHHSCICCAGFAGLRYRLYDHQERCLLYTSDAAD